LEAVRRRPVSARARERATVIGLALLAALMLLALRNDVVRHISGLWR
jgi:membrane-associated protease RseP (regulator of RpoE activity)